MRWPVFGDGYHTCIRLSRPLCSLWNGNTPSISPWAALGELRKEASRKKRGDRRRRNSHLRQLRRLVLHQRDQRRNHHRRLPRNHRRKLVAQRLSASGRHHHTSIVRGQQAPYNILLLGTKLVVSPIAPQHCRQVWNIGHFLCVLPQYSVRPIPKVCERSTPDL